MGSEYNPSSKPHYDITMSKRTRKPLNLEKEADQGPPSPPEDVNEESGNEAEENDHRSLKQLMIIKGKEGRSSLGQHFTAEEGNKQIQVVVKQHEEMLDGVKFKRMVSRYAKVLSHLIKIKGGPRLGSRKKPVLRLTM